tara:strand:+ start:210 stop:506 length:297 start_codon:yes stop_codon:yes gene_type:complete
MPRKINMVMPRKDYYELLKEINSLKNAAASLHGSGEVNVSDLHQMGFLVGRLYRLFNFMPQLDKDGDIDMNLDLVTSDDPRSKKNEDSEDEETNGDFH